MVLAVATTWMGVAETAIICLFLFGLAWLLFGRD
jgi:hypothetical protein